MRVLYGIADTMLGGSCNDLCQRFPGARFMAYKPAAALTGLPRLAVPCYEEHASFSTVTTRSASSGKIE